MSAVQKEIAALRRIANFQGDNHSWSIWGLGMFALDDDFTIEVDGVELKAVIDFYSPNLPDGQDFDPDAWEAEKLELRMETISRKSFFWLYRICRSLLSERTVSFSDGSLLSRQSHLDDVREHGCGHRFVCSFDENHVVRA